MRYRTASGRLALRPAVALKLDGLTLVSAPRFRLSRLSNEADAQHGTWRNGPACAEIDGETVLVTSDEQDEAHLYLRIDDHNLRDGGKLLVRPRHNASTSELQPIQTNYLHAGGSGRLKYSWADFDHDGKLDLLLGTCGYHSIPSNTSGLPACARGKCANNGATVLYMRQEAPAAGEAQLVFEWPKWLTVKGYRIGYGGQEVGVAPYDAGDGNVSIIVATPGGRHVFWAAEDIGTADEEPPLQP